MKSVTFFLYLMTITSILSAQTLEGHVKSFEQSIADATIYVNGTQQATTDEDGKFSVSIDQGLEQQLIIKAEGYKPDTVTVKDRELIGFTLAEAGADYEIHSYAVFGMGCPRCHPGVKKQVNKLDGVLDSKANWREKSITFKVKKGEGPTQEEVISAIERANLTAGNPIQK
jgi:copper chaperone CopZ